MALPSQTAFPVTAQAGDPAGMGLPQALDCPGQVLLIQTLQAFFPALVAQEQLTGEADALAARLVWVQGGVDKVKLQIRLVLLITFEETADPGLESGQFRDKNADLEWTAGAFQHRDAGFAERVAAVARPVPLQRKKLAQPKPQCRYDHQQQRRDEPVEAL